MFGYKTSIMNIDKHDNWNTTINPELLKSFYMTYRSNMTIKYVGNILKNNSIYCFENLIVAWMFDQIHGYKLICKKM